MRNYFKWGFFKAFGIIAITAIIIFAGCKNGTGGDDDPSGNDPPSGSPAISGTVSILGTAQVGETLTANITAFAGSGAALYKWQEDNAGGGTFTNISGGTAGSYTVTVANLSNKIRVTVTHLNYTGSLISGTTAAVTSERLESIDDVETAIDAASLHGDTASDPISLPIGFDLGNMTDSGSNWQKLLTALQTKDKFVALDLSVCTISGGTGTAFAPYKASATGEAKVVSLVLPNAAQTITAYTSSPYTFGRFTALTTVSGANITTVSNCAFYGGTALTSASFPEATTIGNYAFSYCTALPSASFPRVETIGFSAFQNCSVLTSVNFPVVTTIGGGAFGRCSALTSANFPAATTIGDSTFEYCSALDSVNFPEVTSIGDWAFYCCSSLTSATPENFPLVASIGASAFRECSALRSVNFPLVTSLSGERTFYDCTALASVSFPLLTTIGFGTFYYVGEDPGVTVFTVTIGANRTFDINFRFKDYYDSNAQKGGTYTYTKATETWTYTAFP